MRRLDAIRERPLAALGLLCALIALVLAVRPSRPPARASVLVARGQIDAGQTVRARDFDVVEIAAADRVPSMLRDVSAIDGRVVRVRVAPGDYVTASLFGATSQASPLRVGERALSIALAAEKAPPKSLLFEGSRVDVVSIETVRHVLGKTHLLASNVEVLSRSVGSDGSIVVSLRASADAAVALTAADLSDEPIRILVRAPGDRS